MFTASKFEGCLKATLIYAEYSTRTLAWNLLHDWRIGKERFDDFDDDFDRSAGTTEELAFWRSFAHSHFKRVQNPPLTKDKTRTCPSFIDERKNVQNIYGAPGGLSELADSLQLVTITPLTKLWRTFEAASTIHSEFADYKNPLPGGKPNTTIGWLDMKLGHLQRVPWDQHWSDSFLMRLLDFVGRSLATLPYEPTWVALWEEFQSRGYNEPHRWQAMVGVPPSSSDEWLLLQVYPKSIAPPLVRPTQLDAGVWAAHFPHPPCTLHGLAMDLDPGDDGRLTEYIHARADMRPWLDDPAKSPIRACVRVAGGSPEHLAKSQRLHLHALAHRYGPIDGWISEPHPSST